jgi:hypothetical protein
MVLIRGWWRGKLARRRTWKDAIVRILNWYVHVRLHVIPRSSISRRAASTMQAVDCTPLSMENPRT